MKTTPSLLLVDDEEMFVEYLSKRLISRQYRVATCFSGEEAIEKVTDSDFDVVVLDVLMPGIDGLETLREIKKKKPLTEVIILTVYASQESGVDGMNLGAFDYLRKPCDIEDLISKIEGAYEKRVEHEERIRLARMHEATE